MSKTGLFLVKTSHRHRVHQSPTLPTALDLHLSIMKFFRFLILSILALVLFSTAAVSAINKSLPAGMTTVPLATITNDRDSSVSQINLMVNEQAIVRGIYLTTSASLDSSPAQAQGQVYWLSGIESGNGVVLGQGQGVDAIVLRGNIEPKNGYGSLVISYLSNGIFWNYDQCRINLQRVDPHHWKLINSYNNQPVTHIKVKTWALGISTLANVCPTA